MKTYPEIECLKSYFKKSTIRIEKCDSFVRKDFFQVKLSINSSSWEIFIDDEYNDFSEQNPLMNLFLVFNTLEVYADSKNYLAWTHENNLDASDKELIAYYSSLGMIYKEIEYIVGTIDPCISSYDYGLRTGVVKSLASGEYL